MTGTIAYILISVITFLNNILIPFILALAFLFFLWNTVRYFIIESDSEEGRKKARQSALYSIAAFVIIVSLWGIVNLLVSGLGLNRIDPLTPDYITA